MGVDEYVIGRMSLNGSEVDVPRDCAFVKYCGSELIFLRGGISREDMTGDVYHVKAARSVRKNGEGLEGCWDGMWENVDLANPRKTYLGDGCKLSM